MEKRKFIKEYLEPMIIRAFRNLHPTARRLLLARTLRSIGQGALAVDFALYLHALHWSGFAIGLVLGGGGLFGAGLSLLVGLSSDRLRDRSPRSSRPGWPRKWPRRGRGGSTV